MVGRGNLADVRVNTYAVSGLKPMYLYLYLMLKCYFQNKININILT